MELFLKNGDYLPDGVGGVRRALGREELLQRVLWKLTAHRGSFPFLPELGSRLHTLPRHKPSEWQGLAEEYIAQALAGEENLRIDRVDVTRRAQGLDVSAHLNWQGEDLAIKLEVGE